MAYHSALRSLYVLATGVSPAAVEFGASRARDEFGDIQLEWAPPAASSITVKLQARFTTGSTWATVKTWTQAELGASGGTLIDRIPMYPMMRMTVSQGAAGDVFSAYVIE